MSGHIKNAGIRFDPDNYVYLEYDPETPSLNLLIIQNGEIINPMVDYVTNEELTTILGDYVSDSELADALGDYVTDSDLNTALGDYVTDSDLNTALGDYVTDTSLTSTLDDYVTDTELTDALQDYSKLNWVAKSYSGTYTIPSAGYLSIGTAPAEAVNHTIVSMMISSWGSNQGAINLARATGDTIYLIGAVGASISDFEIRFLYFK